MQGSNDRNSAFHLLLPVHSQGLPGSEREGGEGRKGDLVDQGGLRFALHALISTAEALTLSNT